MARSVKYRTIPLTRPHLILAGTNIHLYTGIRNLPNGDVQVEQLDAVGSDEYLQCWEILDQANTLQRMQVYRA